MAGPCAGSEIADQARPGAGAVAPPELEAMNAVIGQEDGAVAEGMKAGWETTLRGRRR